MHGPTEFAAVEDFDLQNKVIDADLVICISEFCRSQLMGLVDERHWDKLAVVHCGVDPAAFTPPARRDEADGRPVRVLCVGRLVGVKGQAVLLQALARLIAEGVNAEVAFVGDGPRAGHLRSEAERLGLSGSVTFTGAVGQDGIGSWYRWADVFCLPSFAEGVPVVLMEAMATGLPVVTTTIAGIPELVEHGRSGLLVPPGRADLLASALMTLVTDPALRSEMGAHGRQAVIAGFTQRECAVRLLEVLSADQPSPSGRQRPRAAEANRRAANGRSSTR
jgi:glycosyltransferase involved in cell wall biosynthesis